MYFNLIKYINSQSGRKINLTTERMDVEQEINDIKKSTPLTSVREAIKPTAKHVFKIG